MVVSAPGAISQLDVLLSAFFFLGEATGFREAEAEAATLPPLIATVLPLVVMVVDETDEAATETVDFGVMEGPPAVAVGLWVGDNPDGLGAIMGLGGSFGLSGLAGPPLSSVPAATVCCCSSSCGSGSVTAVEELLWVGVTVGEASFTTWALC